MSKAKSPRERVYSTGSIQDFLKRKREQQQEGQDQDVESEIFEQNIFKTSKKTARSPKSKAIFDNKTHLISKGKMGELQQQMTTIQQQMGDITKTLQVILGRLDDITEIKKEIKEIREENKQLKVDIKNMKTENKDQLKKFQEENDSLKKKINSLEMVLEKKDKNERKNNIIIKGTNLEGPELKNKVKTYLKNKLQADVEVEEAREIGNKKEGRSTITVKFGNWENKQEVLKNKNKLKGEKIFIDHDLTIKERNIQKKLRDIGKTEAAKGHTVRIGYKKIFINGTKHIWNEELNFLQNN